jgi:hypothetical protein
MPEVEIRVRGVVGRVLTAALESDNALEARAETVLTGRVTDEAELHGLLNRIRDLGLDLVGVHVAVRNC